MLIKKLLLFLLTLSLLAPATMAASIMVPTSVEEGEITIEADRTETITFMVRGDEQEQDIEFFVRTIRGEKEKIHYNGETEFREKRTYDPYQTRTYEISLQGLQEGRVLTEYGFTYSQPDEEGIGMIQVVSGVFETNILCRNCREETTEIDEREEITSQQTGTTNTSLDDMLREAQERERQQQEHNDTETTATTTANTGGTQPTPQFSASDPTNLRGSREATPEGMIALGIFIGLLIAMAVLSALSIHTIRKEEIQAKQQLRGTRK